MGSKAAAGGQAALPATQAPPDHLQVMASGFAKLMGEAEPV